MKFQFLQQQKRLTSGPVPSRFTFHASRITHHASRSGVALVITLILLAVITFMAVTFLVVTRSERNTVTVYTDQTTAKLAANTALQQAMVQMIAPMTAYTNPSTINILVSTNYENPFGFIPGNTFFTNVNFSYRQGGAPLQAQDYLQMDRNLLYSPRVPVYVTNKVYGSNENRSYVDLNRNGRFDPSGLLAETNNLNLAITDPNRNNAIISNWFIGDPQWIGILERPMFSPGLMSPVGLPLGYPHASDNRFISRYAFIVIPTSLSLDINNIHNYGRQLNQNMSGPDGFFRNEGVGPWELNLAAFLADLNTNFWNSSGGPYKYDPLGNSGNSGTAFDDSIALLRYRYNQNWRGNLASVSQLFGNQGVNAFKVDYVDGYARGPLLTTFWQTVDNDAVQNETPLGWSGSDNPNHFFDTQDFFDPNKTRIGVNPGAQSFSDRLAMAGTNNDSYNRYTFFRLLSQLGSESAPEPAKINLNYRNTTNGTIVPDLATNFATWDPVEFFTNTAARLLKAAFVNANASISNMDNWLPMGNIDSGPFQLADTNDARFYNVSNILDLTGKNPKLRIQLYPTNFYTPAVHRLLQLAANIHDAANNRYPTTPAVGALYPSGFPTVLRPRFTVTNDTVFITSYIEVTNSDIVTPGRALLYFDLHDPVGRQQLSKPTSMAYGVPIVIGAKKGFPNFNQFGLVSDMRVARKLHYSRAKGTSGNGGLSIYQRYMLSVSNAFAFQCWNSYSYTNGYPRPVQIIASVQLATSISNEFGFPTAPWGGLLRTNYALGAATNVNSWSGYIDNTPRSFVIPLNSTSNQLMTFDNFYSFNQRSFLREGLVPNDPANQYPLPHWWLNITNRVLCALVDTAANRIIDYVNLSSVEEPVDIMDIAGRTTDGTKSCEGGGGAPNFQGNADNSIGFLFCTNRVGGSISPATQPYGIKYQVDISRNPNATSQQLWDEYNAVKINDKEAAGREFLNNLAGSGRNAQAEFDAPFSPARVVQLNISWQANDPLVHYTVPDLTDLWPESFVKRIQFKRFTELPGAAPISSTDRSALADLSNTNAAPLAGHYHPWTEDLNKNKAVTNATARRMELKDPMVNRSDNWNFPTNKLPGIGWLGRVHRGTPWQTMYLKSPIATNAAAPDIARAANDWMLWSGHVSPVTNYIPYTAKDPIAHYPAPFYGSNGLSFNVDFFLTSPTNDYPLLDLFTTAFNDNASRGQLSVNQTNLAAWSALLSGVTVVTNGTNFDYTFIAPAGVYNTMLNTKSYTWPPLVQIWEGINRLRTNTVLHHDANGFSTNLMFPGGSFTYAGDILRAPELSVASPYLTNALTGSLGGSNALNALTDEVYERIPQQILSLVRADQPRFVVYAFGQALRPAEHSIVPNGPFSGLVTNYAVTAESAIRAVVRVDGAPLNPHVVIESYNALGPY